MMTRAPISHVSAVLLCCWSSAGIDTARAAIILTASLRPRYGSKCGPDRVKSCVRRETGKE